MTADHPSCKEPASKILFGKYKGQLISDALYSPSILAWIKRLSSSPISRSAAIGAYYLESLKRLDCVSGNECHIQSILEDLRQKIADARESMADLDAIYTREHQAVERIRAKLFLLLRPTYEKLDTLQIKVEYRRHFLEALLEGHNDQGEIIAEEEQRAHSRNHQAYEEAGQSASETSALDKQGRAELRAIYRKLATLYHPDKYSNDPESQDSFIELMKLINQAKDSGDIKILQDIAENTNRFLESTGHRPLDLDDGSEHESLQLLLMKLQERISELQNQIEDLRSSSDYELWKLCERDPDFLNAIAEEQIRDLDEEVRKLEDECSILAIEINQNLDPGSPWRI